MSSTSVLSAKNEGFNIKRGRKPHLDVLPLFLLLLILLLLNDLVLLDLLHEAVVVTCTQDS